MISYYNCITSQEFLSMWVSASNHGLLRLRVLRFCASSILPINPSSKITSGFNKSSSSSPLIGFGALTLMEKNNNNNNTSYFSTASAQSRRGSGSGGGGGRGRGSGGGGRGGAPTKDRIDALGKLMTRILRHMASELNLDMRSDGYVKVDDLLKLNLKTFANVPLRLHTIDEIREAVRKDNKQRFSLLEENGDLLIRANQGHSTVPVQSESLLQPILSAEEAPVCVHGTYKRNLESILQTGLKRMNRLHVHFASGLPADGDIISGMRRDVNVLIFLDVRKALEEGMKLYISDNKVILTEGFDGIVPIKYFKKIETWPGKQPIPINPSTKITPGFSKLSSSSSSSSPLIGFGALTLMENNNNNNNNNTSYFSASAQSRRGSGSAGSGGGGGRGRGSGGGLGGGGGAPTKDRIDALGKLMTRILRHMASELNLDMRSDGYVKVDDLLKLNLKTFANVPLRSHTIDEIREAVRKDNKQRFSLLEENGELLIRANQGHSTVPVQSESLLQPILSAEEAPVCVHGTYKRNLESILQTGLKCMNRLHVHFASGLPADGDIISGMRRDVNVLIFLDVRKALEEGLKLYISDNKVILTEGFDGIVPIKYFKKIETWPGKQPIPF